MNETKDLHLPLKATWFNKIKYDTKEEEYRDITPYWAKRLMEYHPTFNAEMPFNKWVDMIWEKGTKLFKLYLQNAYRADKIKFKEFDNIVFTLGYPKKTETDLIMTKRFNFTYFGKAVPAWCPADTPKDKLFFCINFE